MTSKRRLRRYRRMIDMAPWAALVLGSLLSLGAFLLVSQGVRDTAQERTKAEFIRDASEQVERLQRAFQHSIHTLRALHALFASSEQVTEGEFLAFTATTQEHYAGLHVQLWAPQASDASGEHYPVRFARVRDGTNMKSQFPDLVERPDILAQLHQARDSGRLILHYCPLLCKPESPQKILLMILPVYAGEPTPRTIEDRQARLEGFLIQGVFLAPFVEEALGGANRRGIDLWLELGSAPESAQPMLHYPADPVASSLADAPVPSPPTTGPHLREVVSLGQQEIILLATPVPGLHRVPHPDWPWLVLLGGFVLTLLTTVFLSATRRHLGELTQVSRALRVISTSNRTLLRTHNEEELLQKVCNDTVAHGYLLAWVGFAEQDEARSVRVVAKSGIDEGYTTQLKLSWSGDDPHGRGPAGTAIRTGRPVITGDVLEDPDFTPWRSIALQRGFRSVIGLPLGQEGQVFGVLTIYAAEPNAFTQEEVGILQELSEDLAYGITALRLRRAHAASEARLAFLAYNDPLTELPNRTRFTDEVEHAIREDGRQPLPLAVLFIDLDDFKLINDTQGHAIGDTVLRLVAARLKDVLRGEDLLARLGGDEFLVLVRSHSRRGAQAAAEDGMTIVQQAAAVAEKLLHALQQPFHVGEMEYYLRASIGISLCPDHADNVETLLQYADAAMYRAKALGAGSYRFYSSELSERQQQRLRLERRLHKALERNEFRLYYQPLVDLASGRMTGVEALVRWQDPVDGLITPADFLEAAESSGLINALGEWVLQEACRQLADWRARGIELKVAANLSVRQFLHVDMTTQVRKVAGMIGIPFDALELEITESAMMLEADVLEDQVRQLAEAGFSISLDDFGTGYSSLSRLADLPIHVLKIDKSFIDGMLVDPQRWAIVDTVVRFARHLGIRALAEGVETVEQWAELNRMGCHAGQGYHFCQPVPARDIEAAYRALPWGAPPPSSPPPECASCPPEPS